MKTNICSEESYYREGRPNETLFFYFGPLLTPTHGQICSKTQVFVSIFVTRMVLSAQELFAIEKMARSGTGNKKIAITLGLPQSTTKRWLCCSKTLRKNTSFNTSFNTPWHSPQTHTFPVPKLASRNSPKWAAWLIFFNVPQMVENTFHL